MVLAVRCFCGKERLAFIVLVRVIVRVIVIGF